MRIVFDTETDGLLDSVSKIHCLSYRIIDTKEKKTLTNTQDIFNFFSFLKSSDVIIGHNIIRYDLPVLDKLISNFSCDAQIIDTLGLSWYLYPDRKKHGLELWGEDLGVAKPEIKDWKNLTIAEYQNRCEKDVEINTLLFDKEHSYLNLMYDLDGMTRLIGYCNFKLECLKDQEEDGIKLDVYLAEKTRADLEFYINEKIDILANKMPKVVLKEQPSVMYKKDGSLSVNGQKWLDTLMANKLPVDTKVIYKNGNPGSTTQLKSWLFELGWEPVTFKLSKNTGENVPQISLAFGGGLCDSVKDLYTVEPALKELEGLYVAQHRLGLIKSFIENKDDNDTVYPTAHGFTNTMRLQHSKPIVNLPGVFKEYGKEIRGCLTVPSEDYIMCGSDISGLEDKTKCHYIYFFDPKYVEELLTPGFDPHIDIGILSGMISEEDAEFFKSNSTDSDKERYSKIKKIRGTAKVTNFSATYGAGADKIAKTAKISLQEGKKLHSIYWQRNAAVKKTAKACKVREFDGQKWLYNPVSRFWMFLKAEKDRFSTLNQSTGVFVFDSWLREVRNGLKKLGIKVVMQYHDRHICRV